MGDEEISVRRFFREVSYHGTGPNGLTIDFDVEWDPVVLPDAWSDYYDGGVTDAAYQQFINAAQEQLDVDWTQYTHGIFVTPELGCWPTAGFGTFSVRDFSTDTPVTRPLGVVCAGNFGNTLGEWEPGDSSQYYSTTAHELGHTFRLVDLYRYVDPMKKAEQEARMMGGWAMMHVPQPVPYMTVGHRLATGWTRGDWVESLDLATEPLPVDEEVELVPIEVAPGTGEKNALEIVIAEGWSYYFTYRKPQSGQMGDRFLPPDGVVLGTDVVSYGDTTAMIHQKYGLRPFILKLPDDGGDGPILSTVNDLYAETSTAHPTYPTGLTVTLTDKDADSATLRVEFDANERPDPSIRTWPSSTHRWQSPDIEVWNERNEQSSQWKNVPHAGHPNRVVAEVRNRGGLDAPGVVVDFSFVDLSVGAGGTEYSLGSDTEDVGAGVTVTFEAPSEWVVPEMPGHYCIRAAIRAYTDPQDRVELSDRNNFAQSNYDRFISAHGSPARRIERTVTVDNPLEDAALINVVLSQSNPLYRSYVDHVFLRLDGNQGTSFSVFSEFAGDDFLENGGDGQTYEDFLNEPNQLLVQTLIQTGEQDGSPVELGGVEIEVVTGLGTEFTAFSAQEEGSDILVSGEVKVESTGAPVPSGRVILAIRTGSAVEDVTLTLSSGQFSTTIDAGFDQIWAYYLPPSGYGDADSAILVHP